MRPSLSRHSSPRGRPSLVGREREQGLLRHALDDMLAGHGSLALVSGEAGIGKTALVEWLADTAEDQGGLVLRGGCYDLTTTPPYGPWSEVVRRYQPDADLPPVPSFVDDTEALATLQSQAELFDQTWTFFARIAQRRLLILVLEDLHWADSASLDLVRIIARQIPAHRILLVVTYRDDEIDRRHPFFNILPTLVREAVTERLALRPLDPVSIRALIADRYGVPPGDADRLAAFLQTHAEGNPLYAHELLRTLEEAALLQATNDGWVVGDLRHVPVPRLARQVIEGRLGRLDAEIQHLLQVAAVIGQEVPLDLWQRVTGADEPALIKTIAQGRAARLLEETVDGEAWQFTHALIRETLFEDLVSLQRRPWHRIIGATLAATPQPDPDQVAYHFQQAADPRAVAWLIEAGNRAQRAYAWLAAAERFEAAQRLLAADPARSRERAWLLYRIARLTRLTDPAQGVAYLALAERMARAVDDRVLAAYALADLGDHRWVVGDPRRGMIEMAAGDAALEQLVADQTEMDDFTRRWAGDAIASGHLAPRDEVRVIANKRRGSFALALAMEGHIHEGRDLAEQHIAHLERHQRLDAATLESYAYAHLALTAYHWSRGEPVAARAAFARSREIFRQIGHHYLLGACTFYEFNEVVMPYQTDDRETMDQLLSLAKEALQNASGAESEASMLRAGQLPLRLLRGAWQSVIDDGQAETSTPYSEGRSVWGPVTLAKLAAYQGDLTTAWQQVRHELPEGPPTEPGDTYFSPATQMQRIAISLALSTHDLAGAADWLAAHDRWLDWNASVLGRADGALLWAQYHQASGQTALARQQAEAALAQATSPRQPLALIAIHRFLGQLDTDARRFEDADRQLHASLQLADACAAPFERALTLLERAELRLAQRRTEEATVLLDEVQAICAPLDAKPTLARTDALRQRLTQLTKVAPHYPAGLSQREVEVLRLIADGLTDREIASVLSISHFTVMRHVSNVLNKLGVTSRTAAAAIALRQDLV